MQYVAHSGQCCRAGGRISGAQARRARCQRKDACSGAWERRAAPSPRVLDELRRDLSNELLADRNLISVSEVAFMLGYSEPSAFQRAYRRWWGVSARRGVA